MIARDAATALSQPGGDIVDLLRFQHRQIDRALAAVDRAVGADRTVAFERVRAMLRLHEEGEQRTVHPVLANLPTRRWQATDLRTEEESATATLARLRVLGADHTEFAVAFKEFATAIREHAAREESEEHPALRAALTLEQLRYLANQLRSVQAML